MIPGAGVVLSVLLPEGIDDDAIDSELQALFEAEAPSKYNPRSWIGNSKGLFMGYLNFIVEGQLDAEIDIFTDEPPPHNWTGKVSGKLIPKLTLKGRCVGYAEVYGIGGGFDAFAKATAEATLELELFQGQLEWILHNKGIVATAEVKLISRTEKESKGPATAEGRVEYDLLKDDEGEKPKPTILYPPLLKKDSTCRGVLIARSTTD